jgi:hypothetical protein
MILWEQICRSWYHTCIFVFNWTHFILILVTWSKYYNNERVQQYTQVDKSYFSCLCSRFWKQYMLTFCLSSSTFWTRWVIYTSRKFNRLCSNLNLLNTSFPRFAQKSDSILPQKDFLLPIVNWTMSWPNNCFEAWCYKIQKHIFKVVVGDGKLEEPYTDLVLLSTSKNIVLKATK